MTTDGRFGPIAALTDPQSYRNVAFLLTSFPLGMGYFLLVTIGLSLGAGLSMLGVGVLLLMGTLVALRWIAAFERWRVRVLLGRRIEQPAGPPEHDRFLDRLRVLVGAATTWRTVGYTVFVFGFGVAGFTLGVAGVVGSAALISAPLTYDTAYAVRRLGTHDARGVAGAGPRRDRCAVAHSTGQ